MALTLVTSGNTIFASDLNQIIAVLQRSGTSETGQYIIKGNAPAINNELSTYIHTTSQGVTPSSVSIDTSVLTTLGVGAPAVQNISASGFLVHVLSSGAGTDCHVGGVYTANY